MTRALVVVLISVASTTRAAPNRFAVVIGANDGDRDEPRLRFAESDADRLARALREVGGFAAENVVVMMTPPASEVRRTLIALNARIRGEGTDALLIVFYSGHADAESLHLRGSRFAMQELRDLVAGSHASARILVLDACRSGALTRVKGGHAGPGFALDLTYPIGAQGLAILSSSAAGEAAQESDDLGGSFFSHAFVSALLGAGDANDDGVVTLSEAFAYARERTLAATAATVAGPQHPTFRIDIGGREDIALTRPGRQADDLGALEFPEPGRYLVHRGHVGGAIVAELVSDKGGRRLALDPGRYFVVRREPEYLLEGELTVDAGEATVVEAARLRRVDYARVVRKGGSERRFSLALSAQGGVRGELVGLGIAWQVAGGLRLDLRPISLELLIGGELASHANRRTRITSRQLDASLVGVHVFDVGPLGLGVGVELGGGWLRQGFADPALVSRDSALFFFGAVGAVEIPLVPRLDVRLEAAALTYLVPIGDEPDTRTLTTSITYRASVGMVVHLR